MINLEQYAHAHPYYPFLYNDGGRAQSKRPKQKDDCSVRAVAIITGRPYDEVYDLCAERGRKSGGGFNLNKIPELLIWHPLPAEKGKPRLKLMDFYKHYPKGEFILRVSKHYIAVKNGIAHDSFESRPDKCVYGYFIKRNA